MIFEEQHSAHAVRRLFGVSVKLHHREVESKMTMSPAPKFYLASLWQFDRVQITEISSSQSVSALVHFLANLDSQGVSAEAPSAVHVWNVRATGHWSSEH